MKKAIILGIVLTLSGCAMEGPASTDGPDDVALGAGKADGTAFTECELDAVVRLVNSPDTTSDSLRAGGVHTRAANNLMAARPEGGFADIQAIDDVSWVGPVAMRQLVDMVADRCEDGGGSGDTDIEVRFSPLPHDESHLGRTRELIDQAQRSLDIAMYSFSDAAIKDALERAVQRGVSVRMVFDPAQSERLDPAGTMSAKLEELGIDVRYVNKIMHDKFVIIDGVRTAGDDPTEAVLASGSANWSGSAGTVYEENTLFVHHNAELALRYQREFNLMWEHSRDFAWSASAAPAYFESEPITDEMIAAVEDPTVDAFYTSPNFRITNSATYGWGFTVVRGQNSVADRLVAAIQGARESIHIASGHMRSRPVAEALMAAHRDHPELDIRVYLDDQEWISEYTADEQQRDLENCLADAGTSEAAREDCVDNGFYFGYPLAEDGIPVRYKFYAYRWHYSYAPQMHDKFMIVDHRTLISGSYNLSDNAEHNTLENMMLLEGEAHADIVGAYESEFERMWVTGRDENLLDQLTAEVTGTSSSFPIVFAPMALEWADIDALKRAIRDNCPTINDADFRTHPESHRYCNR